MVSPRTRSSSRASGPSTASCRRRCTSPDRPRSNQKRTIGSVRSTSPRRMPELRRPVHRGAQIIQFGRKPRHPGLRLSTGEHRARSPGQPGMKRPMAITHPVGIVQLRQPLPGVHPDRLQQPVAGPAVALDDVQHRLRGQRGEQLGPAGGQGHLVRLAALPALAQEPELQAPRDPRLRGLGLPLPAPAVLLGLDGADVGAAPRCCPGRRRTQSSRIAFTSPPTRFLVESRDRHPVAVALHLPAHQALTGAGGRAPRRSGG